MEKIIKFLFIIILLVLNIYAKDQFTINTSYFLTKENLSLEEIKQIKDFIPSSGENLSFKNQKVWIKIDIKNQSNEELSRIFKFTFPYMDNIVVYKDDRIEKYGRTNNYNTEMLSIDNNVFRVRLNALEEKIVFINITSSYAMKTFMKNFTEEEYLNDLFFKKGLLYFCYGIIFSLIFYNFFIWYTTRKKEFFYYVLFHFSLLIGIISWSGFGFQYIWPNLPQFNYYSYGIIVNIILGFQILYVIYYLDTEKYLPKITSFLKIASKIFFFFSLTSPLFELTLLYEIASILSTIFLLLVTIYLTFVKKVKLAFYIFIAELILITGNFLMALSDFGIINGFFYTEYFYVWGASVEVILISLALSYKYNILEEQKAMEKQKRIQTETMLIDKQKLSSIGENFNNLVHQFRQPLSQINSVVCLIYSSYKKGNLTDDLIDENLNHIELQTSHLSKTLEYFRNFTTNKESNTTFLLFDFVDKVEILMEFMLKTNNILLEKDFDKNISLKTDETQFLQVISVLITNAKDAFIENDIKEPKILIKANKENNILNMTISNNAGAIDPIVKDKIFEPYFTTKNSSEATGLGLYITKLIIENKLKSSIVVETHNEWTSFIMKIKNI